MFREIEKNKVTEYIIDGRIIIRITFNREWGLNILKFHGDFTSCSKLKEFDEGNLGNIKIESNSILINSMASSEKLASLFNVIEEYEPKIKHLREKLFALRNSPKKSAERNSTEQKCPDKNLKTSSFALDDILADLTKTTLKIKRDEQLKRMEKNPEEDKDLRSMYKRLTRFNDRELLEVKATTTVGKSCRTVKAHYRHSDYRCDDQEDICRTTFTDSKSSIAYIEYRTKPEKYYELEEKRVPATHEWLIKFNTERDASKYLFLLPGFKKYTPLLFSPVDPTESNLFLFDSESIDGVLTKLVKAGACPESAIEQHKAVQFGKSFTY